MDQNQTWPLLPPLWLRLELVPFLRNREFLNGSMDVSICIFCLSVISLLSPCKCLQSVVIWINVGMVCNYIYEAAGLLVCRPADAVVPPGQRRLSTSCPTRVGEHSFPRRASQPAGLVAEHFTAQAGQMSCMWFLWVRHELEVHSLLGNTALRPGGGEGLCVRWGPSSSPQLILGRNQNSCVEQRRASGWWNVWCLGSRGGALADVVNGWAVFRETLLFLSAPFTPRNSISPRAQCPI